MCRRLRLSSRFAPLFSEARDSGKHITTPAIDGRTVSTAVIPLRATRSGRAHVICLSAVDRRQYVFLPVFTSVLLLSILQRRTSPSTAAPHSFEHLSPSLGFVLDRPGYLDTPNSEGRKLAERRWRQIDVVEPASGAFIDNGCPRCQAVVCEYVHQHAINQPREPTVSLTANCNLTAADRVTVTR